MEGRMEKVLADFDFSTGIDEEYIQEIKDTCLIFQHITFAPNGQDWGGCLNKEPW
jgi:hypothetical protein